MEQKNPTDYILHEATIVNSLGMVVDVSLLIKELNVYEDVFSNVMSGDMTLVDTQNLPSKLHMHGNEFFVLSFESPDQPKVTRVFRIYKISNLSFNNTSSFFYKIHFCSEEFFISHQKRVSKSYNNYRNNEIIQDIMTNYLGSQRPQNFEETKGMTKIIVPNMMPFEAINWISSFSINDQFSSAYLFFENFDGFNFKSLHSLFNGNIRKEVLVAAKNINLVNESEELQDRNQFKIDALKYDQLFDSLETLSTGGFSSGMKRFDVLRQKHETLAFDMVTNKAKRLNDHPTINDATNRFGEQLFDGSSYYKYFTTFQGMPTDKWLLQRASQLALLNSQRLQIQLSGDSGLKCGDMLYVDFPNLNPQDDQNINKDPYKSGLYLIGSVRHKFFQNKYVNVIQLLKDSHEQQIPQSAGGLIYDTVKKQ